MIPVNTPSLPKKSNELVNQCVETGWISSEGSFIKKFEEDFSNCVGRKYGVAVANGSAALEIAIRSLKLESGGEVIIPTFTIISCAQAVTNNSLVPVLVDCDPHTFNCDAASIRQKITPRTKAVMVVHIYGLPVDMNPILELCRENNLFLIEDAAEVIGQTYRGKQCGSFGDISTFSFYPNKHITTGEGGMVVCDDIKIAERGKYLRNLCFKDEKRFHHDEIGYNYRMTNLQAALGVAQVPELPDIVKKKRSIGRQYYERLQNLKSCSLPVCETSYAQNIYWVFSIVIKPNSKVTREEVVNELSNKRIGTRPFFIPMHMQPVFQDMGLFKNEEYPNSEYISKNGFYVPSGLGLTTADVNDVCDALIKVLS